MSYNNQEVHAPYHFVPLSKWVYMPDWAHLVSHDYPFEDGYSGVIDYTLTNATPLCVGGEQIKKEGQPSLVKWATDPKGNPVIPGSSMKGMLRSVMEIAGFGKLSEVDDEKFSYREVSSKSSYLDYISKQKVQPGWIKFNDSIGRWEFTDCQCAKIGHSEIKEGLNCTIKNDDTAVQKYKKWHLNKEIKTTISEPKGVQKNKWAEMLSTGTETGHLIFTNKRIKGPGKMQDYEFSYCFYNTQDKPKFIDIDKQVQDLFSNHLEEQVNYLRKNPNESKGIPVFALTNKTGNTLHSIGLAKMPRVSYKNSIGDLVKRQNKANQSDAYFDLAELIFGTLRENGLSLKSRISFSDATTQITNTDLFKSNSLVLNGPKATFYPAYLEQSSNPSKNKKYSDYDDDTAPAGRKRYISKEPEFDKLTQFDLLDKENVASQMELATVGTEFKGKVIYHNLKAEELGALIWVMRLGDNIDSFHSLGHGKPYGAGAIQLSAKITTQNNNNAATESLNENDFMNKFINKMDFSYPFDESWSNSPQLKYLHALSNMRSNFDINTRYMSIDNNEYQDAKNLGSKLESFNNIKRFDSNYEEYCVSPSFAKGRLSHLIDENSSWENEQKGMQEQSIIKTQERIEKTDAQNKKLEQKRNLAEEKEKLKDSDLAPYEKCKSFLSLIVKDQDSLNGTERKNKIKELRGILKEIKDLTITTQEAASLIDVYSKITLSKKDTDKAIKYLSAL